MKLLLHICCAPCEIYPLERLKKKGFEIKGLFYNPNIHPLSEYQNRRQAVEGFSCGMEVIYPEYDTQDFFRAVSSREDSPQRCSLCWGLRLETTAKIAREKECTHFSTTLLVSPYQDQEALKKIASRVAEEEGIEFYYEDFRPGFREAHNKARAQGIYCQKYCGCIYSMPHKQCKN